MALPQDIFDSLTKKINKAIGKSDNEDTALGASDSLPELELDMKDDDLISLTNKWKQAWDGSDTKTKWLEQCEQNEKYWLGQQYGKDPDQVRPLTDNIIFEALETFLPQATRKNPEAMVEPRDESPDNDAYALKIKEKLAEIADKIKIRLKIKRAARYWAVYLLGVAKVGWSMDIDDVSVKIIRPQKMILDPEAVVDEDGYNGRFVGEIVKMEASILAKIVPNKAKEIKDSVKDEMGTDIQFIQWWTDEYTCWVLNDKVLLKKKNPNWNYDQDQPAQAQPGVEPETGEPSQPENPTQGQKIPGINHFTQPRKPYVFLSIFNLGRKPVDETSLISQNLSMQDLVNKRNRQIDRNADNQNGGMVVSLGRSGLTKDQAKNVSDALRKGGVVAIPDGAPRDAIDRFPGNNLPSDMFTQMNETRERLRDVFGVRGSTPAGIENETTVRGKIIVKGLDTDRIGGGITEYLEQFADDIYNHIVQQIYVYYPEVQQLFAQGFQPPKLIVSVKEGSLLPKDSTSMANQAIELASAGKMSLIDMYKRLEYPNPEDMAANVWLEANAPEMLYKDNPLVKQVIQIKAQAVQAAATHVPGSVPNGAPAGPSGDQPNPTGSPPLPPVQ